MLKKKIIKPKWYKQKRKEKDSLKLQKQMEKSTKMATTTLLSISTLNVGGLNTPVKWNWVADWIKKKKWNKTFQYVAYTRHFSIKDKHRLKVQSCKNIFHKNRNDKKCEWH